MGWTSTHKTKGQPLLRFFEREFNYDTDARSGKVLLCKAHVFAGVAYLAYQTVNKLSGQTGIHGLVVLFRFHPQDYHNFSYKEIEESMGPCECGCPQSILEILTPTDNETAKKWRTRCWQRLREKKPLRTGDIIRFDYPIQFKRGGKHKIFKVHNAKKLWFKVAGDPGLYKIGRKLLSRGGWEVLDAKRCPEEDLPLLLGLHPSLDRKIADRLNPGASQEGKCPATGVKCEEYKDCHDQTHCHLK